jgi:hypothetical protein
MRRLAITFTSMAAACGGTGDDGDDEMVDCTLETRDDEFVVGLEKLSPGGYHFQLMQSVPAPPARHDNQWTLHIADAAGAPLAGATVTVVPFMPDHGHGTGVSTVVTESTTVVGEYDANPVNLFMPGLWEVYVTVDTAPPAMDEQVVYRFCIPG